MTGHSHANCLNNVLYKGAMWRFDFIKTVLMVNQKNNKG